MNKSESARIYTTDESFTVLTDEIVEATTPNSVSFSFNTKTPLNPDAEFENLVLYKKEGEPFKY
ncbi:hypothetical protein [Formosa sp. PL04]|uniref:hypothetical protein n=1 Tax=Formosa sp. PL04 TaxID=3081755 RepID=UPI002982A4A7|nr:hypothetical protein [Formosa sp. PL04]MDW5290841.1 hypothetical protein [Formosa sp. PL04]